MPKPAPRSPWRWSVAVALAGVGLAAGGCGERRSGGGSTPEGAATPAASSVASSPAEPDKGAAEAGAAADAETSAPADARTTSLKRQVVQDDEVEDEPRPAAAAAAGDEPRGDRFADLEVLCAALNKDYVDGTLTDYYGALKGKMTTAFGDDLRRRGEASMEPGRILEAGRKTLGDAAGDPATPACDKLFDELDDLE